MVMPHTFRRRVRGRLVSIVILCIAVGLILFLSSNWTAWAGEGELRKTHGAYLRADVSASRSQTGRAPKSISRSPENARQRFC